MKSNFKTIKYLGLISQIGFVMAIPIFGGVFLGHWLDMKLGTNIIFLIICIVAGVYIAFRNLFVTISRFDDDQKETKR